METGELLEILRSADGAIQKCFPSIEGGATVAQCAVDKIEELEQMVTGLQKELEQFAPSVSAYYANQAARDKENRAKGVKDFINYCAIQSEVADEEDFDRGYKCALQDAETFAKELTESLETGL